MNKHFHLIINIAAIIQVQFYKSPTIFTVFYWGTCLLLYKDITILSAEMLFPRSCSFLQQSLYSNTPSKFRHYCSFHKRTVIFTTTLITLLPSLRVKETIFPKDNILYSVDVCEKSWRALTASYFEGLKFLIPSFY